MKSNVKELTLADFPDEFKNPTVIFFSREGCHFCRKLKPIYNRISLSEKYEKIYDFYIVDADEENIIYEKFQPDGVPTIYVLYGDDGIEIPYPNKPALSGYGEKDITNFLDKLMEE